MSKSRWILLVEDSADDAELAVRALRRGGCQLTYQRVDTPEAMLAALEAGGWEVVIADYSMPRFNGLAALKMVPLAVDRELRDSAVRAERNRAEVGYRDGSSPKRLNIAELWLRQDERARLKAIIEREGVVKNFEMEVRRPDGSVIWCEQSARAIYDAAGHVSQYEGVLVNINSRKLAEEETNRARDLARDLALESARLRSDFRASMSHEIRTPLVGIIGTGELLSLPT